MARKEIGEVISSNIVYFLQKEKNMTLKQIGDLMKLGESFISRVKNEQRSFTLRHLCLLEQSLGFPFPFLILMSRDEKSISSRLRYAYMFGEASAALLAVKMAARRAK